MGSLLPVRPRDYGAFPLVSCGEFNITGGAMSTNSHPARSSRPRQLLALRSFFGVQQVTPAGSP
jgi:hypothetical protein